MAPAAIVKHTKKRKATAEEVAPAESSFPQDVGLELGSDAEAEGEESDDEEAEEFPEIDTGSDSEGSVSGSEELEDEDEEEEDEEDEEEEDSDYPSDDEIQPFPKAKTVISNITGQPKRVYPEIEPDYDSDSSTEDVSLSLLC